MWLRAGLRVLRAPGPGAPGEGGGAGGPGHPSGLWGQNRQHQTSGAVEARDSRIKYDANMHLFGHFNIFYTLLDNLLSIFGSHGTNQSINSRFLNKVREYTQK